MYKPKKHFFCKYCNTELVSNDAILSGVCCVHMDMIEPEPVLTPLKHRKHRVIVHMSMYDHCYNYDVSEQIFKIELIMFCLAAILFRYIYLRYL
jgi:hypothetical protein